MATHSRSQGRRSLSGFSLQHFRSLTRAGPNTAQNQTPSPSLRSPSSLSCNPYRQTPTSPEPTAAVSNVVVEGLINSPPVRASSKITSAQIQTRMTPSENKTMSRPRSWFSFPRASQRKHSRRNLSVHLPEDSSSSTVARSVISAPVLTGTTNMDVAEAEGVCCRDIIDAGLTVSLKNSKSQASSKSNKMETKHTKVNKTGLFRISSAREARREKTKSVPFDSGLPVTSENPSEETWRFSNFERGIARRRAETVNLCREKINKLTGHGRIKRKSMVKEDMIVPRESRTVDNSAGDIIDQPQASTSNTENVQFLSLNNSNPDLVFGSLTKSFASAIDKLDFQSSSSVAEDMAFVRSRSSIFNLKRRNKPADSTNTKKDDQGQHETGTALQSGSSADCNANRIKTEATIAEVLEQTRHPLQSSKVGSPPQPMQFSAAANGYVASQPVPHYPRGVKALGMHSNTMDFATAPSWVTDLPKPPGKAAIARENEDDGDDEVVIENAPIYSPSLGDLSQYARPTPPSAPPVTHPGGRLVPETPTQAEKSYMKRLGGIRKSKSGMGLLSIFNRTQKEPLQTRDINQKLDKRQQLKKSRSVNLAALLKRGETALTDSQQPKASIPPPSHDMKPSPLRHESQVQSSPTSASTRDGVRRRSPPRGSVTPADRAKRMGIVGMPCNNLDK